MSPTGMTDKPACDCDPYLLSLVAESQSITTQRSKSGKFAGLVLASITGGAAVLLSAVCFPFVAPALRRVRILGLPFIVPLQLYFKYQF